MLSVNPSSSTSSRPNFLMSPVIVSDSSLLVNRFSVNGIPGNQPCPRFAYEGNAPILPINSQALAPTRASVTHERKP